MVYSIEEIRKMIIPIAKTHGVKSISLFGSYARGEANENSDVDFYIDKGEVTDLFKYFELIEDLENKLKCHVDVITTGIQDKNFLNHIKKEGVLLYEQG